MSSIRLLCRNGIIYRTKLSSPTLSISHKSFHPPIQRGLLLNQYRCFIITNKRHSLLKNDHNTKPTRNLSKSLFCTKPPPTSTPPPPPPPSSDDESSTKNEEENDDDEWEYREVLEEDVRNRNYPILSWRMVIGTIIVFGIGAIIFQQQVHQHRQKQKEPQYASYGEAQIGGGEWKMIDHNNQSVDQSTLMGKYQIVYFGFTFCPDVCPRELTKMANAMHLLEEKGFNVGQDILPVFVSVDPKRDTPELVKKYIKQFHPAIYGLTGSPEQVASFAKAYKAYFSTPGPGENKDDYIVDHVTMMYVMDRGGQYIGHISTLENADEMAMKIANMIKDSGHSGGFLGKWFKDPSQLIDKKK